MYNAHSDANEPFASKNTKMENVIMNLKKILACVLAVVMLLSFAACDSSKVEVKDDNTKKPEPTKPAATEPEDTTPEDTTPEETDPPAEVKPISFFSMNYTAADGSMVSMFAYDAEDGTAYFEIVSDVVKKTNLDISALDTLSQAAAEANVAALDGQVYGESFDAYGELYIQYADETMVMATVNGEMPDEFADAMEAMLACMLELTADVEEYVAAPIESGEIAESDKNAIYEILNEMDLQAPDSYGINGIAKDEYFCFMLGLSSDEGIVSGLSFTPFNGSIPFGLSIVTLEEGASVSAVAEDFEENLDWAKLICVQPEKALIATKGNQVLLMTGSEMMYEMTAFAIEAAGWTVVTTLENPNM